MKSTFISNRWLNGGGVRSTIVREKQEGPVTVSQDANPEYHGTSVSYCDPVLRHQLAEFTPRTLVDFGAGAGKVGRMAREVLGESVKLIAVEGYEKTAEMLTREGIYHEVHHALIQDWIQDNNRNFDMAVFGDVLEHLNPWEVHQVIRRCLSRFKQIIILCPLQDVFQEDLFGNRLEVHRTYVTSGFFDRYRPQEKHIVRGNRYTIMNVRIDCHLPTDPLYRRLSWWIFHRLMLVLQPLGLARPFVLLLKRTLKRFRWLLRG